MKKSLLLVITFLYGLVSSGIAMDIHYCMGKRAGVDLWHHGNDRCSTCGMKSKKSKCCHNKIEFYKLTVDHKQSVIDYSFPLAVHTLEPVKHPLLEVPVSTISTGIPYANGPPLARSGLFICILNGVFRL
ncbi:MAG TPA: hypothetical protein PKK69_05655 [Ferruginibacter sp.]|nr:hypothetical protein [Ferruginibacter sp.]